MLAKIQVLLSKSKERSDFCLGDDLVQLVPLTFTFSGPPNILLCSSTVAFHHACCASLHPGYQEQKQGEESKGRRFWAGEGAWGHSWAWSGCDRLCPAWTGGTCNTWRAQQGTPLQPEGQLEEQEQRRKWPSATTDDIFHKNPETFEHKF